MGDVNSNERSALSTVSRTIVFQSRPGDKALAGPFVIVGDVPIPFKVTTASDPTGHDGSYTGQVKLDGIVPDTPMQLQIFDQTYDLVVKGDVQTDPKKLSFYRERLYMLGYVTGREFEAVTFTNEKGEQVDNEFQGATEITPVPDLDLPALPTDDGKDPVKFAAAVEAAISTFRKQLSSEFLEGLAAFQVDHQIPVDDNLLGTPDGDSEAIKNTRLSLSLNAGS